MDPRHENRKAVRLAAIQKLSKSNTYMYLSAHRKTLELQKKKLERLYIQAWEKEEECGIELLNEKTYRWTLEGAMNGPWSRSYPEKEDFAAVGLDSKDLKVGSDK